MPRRGRSRILMLKRQKIVAVVDDDPSMLRATRDLLDLGGMSGIDLRRQLTAANCSLPVIFMTALDDELTHREARAAGCVAVLRKPYSARQLMDAIEKAAPGA